MLLYNEQIHYWTKITGSLIVYIIVFGLFLFYFFGKMHTKNASTLHVQMPPMIVIKHPFYISQEWKILVSIARNASYRLLSAGGVLRALTLISAG